MYKNTRSEGFGEEVRRRILLGTYALSSGYYDAYYKKAQKACAVIRNSFNEAFKKYDVILTPTAPNTAWKFGEKSTNPTEMYLEDICTVSVNIAGLPAMSVPCGNDSNGLPIGMQLIGKELCEQTLIRAAYAFEVAI
jgi:aspartyl-tRNA(Asn)/glutamyl-tRNA(Gln) amidotransferase subunit A